MAYAPPMLHLRHMTAGLLVACLTLAACGSTTSPTETAVKPAASVSVRPPEKAKAASGEFGTYEQCVAYPALEKFQWPRATIEAFCADEFTPVLTRRDIRKMIEAGEGRKLDAAFDDILREYQSGKLPEGSAWYAYGRFDRVDDETGAVIARWLEQSPGSAHALAARGIHHMARGAEARGTTFYADVPREKLARMKHELELANDDLLKAIEAITMLLPPEAPRPESSGGCTGGQLPRGRPSRPRSDPRPPYRRPA